MKPLLLLIACLFLSAVLVFPQGVRVATAYNYPLLTGSKTDSVLNGLKSIRGCTFDPNVEGNGKGEIALTNYNDNGHVHVFEVVGNDSIQLVWTSPTLTPGGSSTPRWVMFGDLDNDGKKEVIFQLNSVGILIFEWDGVPGSHNFGTQPSQVISSPPLAGLGGNAEYMEISDVDGDGQNELTVAYNGSTNDIDGYYVFSASGDWNTNDPGFSSFNAEFTRIKATLGANGLSGGSPVAMIAANLDGAGNKEILIHDFDLKTVTPMRVPSADTYQLSDTTSGKAYYRIGGTNDYVALFGGLAYDIDGDGREEVYLPTYVGSIGGPGAGKVDMVSYNQGQSTAVIDSSNITTLDLTPVTGAISNFGFGYGDIDGNGKKNLYFTTSYPANVVTLEFQGGDKRNPANWTLKLLYAGDSTIVTDVTYKDSLGVKDTIRVVDPSFASKIYAHKTDFDKDGKEDILLPYQALSDSINRTFLTWNSGASRYDSVVNKIVNPKRWGFRIIEATGGTGVEVKDLTVITPSDYRLEQNYPNPFNPSTTIAFYLPVKQRISLKLYDELGREMRTLINNEEYPAGSARVVWDGKNNAGRNVASGTYFYTLRFGNFEKTNKMMLLR